MTEFKDYLEHAAKAITKGRVESTVHAAFNILSCFTARENLCVKPLLHSIEALFRLGSSEKTGARLSGVAFKNAGDLLNNLASYGRRNDLSEDDKARIVKACIHFVDRLMCCDSVNGLHVDDVIGIIHGARQYCDSETLAGAYLKRQLAYFIGGGQSPLKQDMEDAARQATDPIFIAAMAAHSEKRQVVVGFFENARLPTLPTLSP